MSHVTRVFGRLVLMDVPKRPVARRPALFKHMTGRSWVDLTCSTEDRMRGVERQRSPQLDSIDGIMSPHASVACPNDAEQGVLPLLLAYVLFVFMVVFRVHTLLLLLCCTVDVHGPASKVITCTMTLSATPARPADLRQASEPLRRDQEDLRALRPRCDYGVGARGEPLV